MALPALLYNNLFAASGVTITSSPGDASGYPKENVADWRVGTVYAWKSSATTSPAYIQGQLSATTCDLCVIGGHNLTTAGATITIQHSTDGTTFADDATFAATDWHDEYPIPISFSSGTFEFWRVNLAKGGGFSAAPRIAVITLGQKLSLPTTPPDLDPYAEEPVSDWVDAETGAFLGSNFRFRRKEFTINPGDAGYSYADFFQATGRNFDRDFMVHAREKPFWFVYDTALDTRLVCLCRLNGMVSSPFVSVKARRGLNLPVTGYLPAVDF